MRNVLLEQVEYMWQENAWGTWRRYLYSSGQIFAEFQSHATLPNGWPLIHITWGRNPETGRRIVAKGGLAVGRRAVGILALGQASAGILAMGQASFGVVLGVGQVTSACFALGQVALGWAAGLGQLATGGIALGQLGFGGYVLAQLGIGLHVLSAEASDPAAVAFFMPLLEILGRLGHPMTG